MHPTATENIQADEGEDEAKDEDEIWTNLWTVLEALKPPQPKPLYCPEPKPLYCPEPKPLKSTIHPIFLRMLSENEEGRTDR